MTFNDTYYEFDQEVTRLEDAIDSLQDDAADLADDNPQKERVLAEVNALQAQRKGVVWARDRAYESDDFPQWDDDVDGVTLGAIRAGTYGSLQDDLERDPNAGSGTSTNLLVAEGTVEAPYIDDSMSDAEQAGAVAQLHPWYRQWAEARINELLDPEGNENASVASPEETPTQATSTDE